MYWENQRHEPQQFCSAPLLRKHSRYTHACVAARRLGSLETPEAALCRLPFPTAWPHAAPCPVCTRRPAPCTTGSSASPAASPPARCWPCASPARSPPSCPRWTAPAPLLLPRLHARRQPACRARQRRPRCTSLPGAPVRLITNGRRHRHRRVRLHHCPPGRMSLDCPAAALLLIPLCQQRCCTTCGGAWEGPVPKAWSTPPVVLTPRNQHVAVWWRRACGSCSCWPGSTTHTWSVRRRRRRQQQQHRAMLSRGHRRPLGRTTCSTGCSTPRGSCKRLMRQ